MNRTCPDCGVPLEADEQFCGNCGCYLDWSDEPEPEAVPEAAPEPAAEAPAPGFGFVGRVRSALGGGDDAATSAPPAPPAAPPPVGAPVAGPPGPPPAAPPTPRTPTAPPPPPPRRSPLPPTQAPAQALVAPQQPGPQQPQARQPGSAAPPARRRSAAPPEAFNPGDLVCGHCGIGNKPTRKFCRRCGHDLVDAEVAKVSWFKRVFGKRPDKVREAGSRPKAARTRRGFPTRLVTALVVVAGLGVGGFLLRGVVGDGIGTVMDGIKGVERVVPDQVEASSAQRGHGANLVVDGTPNKYWAPARPGDGRGEYVEATFDSPVRLVEVLITPGVSKEDEEAFLQQGRPKELRVTMTRDDGTTEVRTIELESTRGAKQESLRVSDVTSVRFEIQSAYAGNLDGSRTAIGEIEFFVRK